jgi:hypothetical protein
MSYRYKKLLRLLATSALLVCSNLNNAAVAETAGLPRLYTNQQYVEDVTRKSSLEVTEPEAVLEYVLNSLPDRVKVYPTENYFYFYFYQNGIKWAGNLRFDVETRDEGKVHMSYFRDFTQWHIDETDFTVVWDIASGVDLKKLADLEYKLSFKGRSVVFEMNSMAGIKPPETLIGENEQYLGPVFDESGIRFFLFFDPDALVFKYILDETDRVADEILESEVSPEISIGRRTGFAFVEDKYLPRKQLIGVYGGNIALNTYLDGPFDQLGDNFFKGDELREAILAVSPELDGTIDRFGNSEDGSVRYLIAPYISYEYVHDLGVLLDCKNAVTPTAYYSCLNINMASGPAGEEYPPEDDVEKPSPNKNN